MAADGDGSGRAASGRRSRARRVEGRARARARPQRAGRLACSTTRRSTSGRAAARRPDRHLYVPLVVQRPADRRGHRARQGRAATRASRDDDLRLAETFAARAAIAVDLSERVSRDALRRVVEAQELERQRLARELHDETGQALTSILLGLKPLEETGDREDARGAWRRCASSSSRRCRTCAGSRSSCGPRRSTTSGSCRRSSGCADLRGADRDRGRLRGAARRRAACRARSRRRSTGSCRRRSRTWSSTPRRSSVSIVAHPQATARSTAVIEDDGAGFDPRRRRGRRHRPRRHARAGRAASAAG